MEYHARIRKIKDVYAVEFPDLCGCYSQGDTLHEARTLAADALNGWLASMTTHGYPIPAPAYDKGHAVAVKPEIKLVMELRMLRGERTQKEAAALLGITQQSYRKLEDPRNANPKLETLLRVVSALGGQLDISIRKAG